MNTTPKEYNKCNRRREDDDLGRLTICGDQRILERGKERARRKRQSFSGYVITLIEKDVLGLMTARERREFLLEME